MVGQQIHDDSLQCLVVLDAGVLLVRVLHGILIGFVSGDLDRNLLSDDLSDLVLILPVDVTELLVECA